jgi:hypothetical protein
MSKYAHLLDIEPVQTEDEANLRAQQFKQLDPFPDIPPALFLPVTSKIMRGLPRCSILSTQSPLH